MTPINNEIFARKISTNLYLICHENGEPVYSLDADVYPLDAEGNELKFGARYSTDDGIHLNRATVEALGIEFE